ncbi:UNVERIFIED_CONTAM: hypothetical protein FKN15_066933 [Acipenser sinensis]
MLSFMHSQYTFFQQGYKLLDEIDPYMKKLAAELDQLVIDSAVEKRDMEHKHAIIQQRDFSYDDSKAEFNVDASNGVVVEGYLFKRASNAFKTWNRGAAAAADCVFPIVLQDSLTVVVEDLRLCSVKPCEDIERRFCFEVVSPTKSCMLQADSEKLRQAWIHAVQASIASAYRESPDNYSIQKLDRTASPSTSSIDSASDSRDRSLKGESILQRVQSIPGNEVCCDCGQADPRWASINLGILLCIECSGIHRSLGVHCSKVRSLTLDSWEPELLKLMCELGNNIMNHIYETRYKELGLKKPVSSSSRQEKEAWIKAKYVEKKFLKKMPIVEALREVEQKSRRWSVKKCQRHNSSTKVPAMRRRYRQEAGNASPGTLVSGTVQLCQGGAQCTEPVKSGTVQLCQGGAQCTEPVKSGTVQLCQGGAQCTEPVKSGTVQLCQGGAQCTEPVKSAAALERKFRRDSLFCPDELDSLFSYFDTGSGPRSLSSDSGLGGSTNGSTDILVFGSVVDSVTEEECEVSEESSGEAEIEQEASDTEDLRELTPGMLIYKAAQARNMPVMAEALAHGADVNWINDEDENKTPLIQAVTGNPYQCILTISDLKLCLMASIVFVVVLQGSLIACEFLLQNAADVNQRDIRGRGPLHHATYLGHTGQVCLFLKRGANQHGEDADGQDPLSIAVQAANADIVTLLTSPVCSCVLGDTTYLDIFREFSHMASNNPEKLNRRSVHFSHSCRRGRELASLDLLLLEMSSQPVNENNVN